ncbi:hypothetical protein [Chitiniphilus shinanonensis]|uniref:hypothetical protein n=1 Tax=Chitiniphilus shinanonensis TaxID=553088 RepID=UPI0033408C10
MRITKKTFLSLLIPGLIGSVIQVLPLFATSSTSISFQFLLAALFGVPSLIVFCFFSSLGVILHNLSAPKQASPQSSKSPGIIASPADSD